MLYSKKDDTGNGPKTMKLLEKYIDNRCLPRNIHWDQANCLIETKNENFCKNDNNNIITVPTIKRQLGSIKVVWEPEELSLKASVQIIAYQTRICRQKNYKSITCLSSFL